MRALNVSLLCIFLSGLCFAQESVVSSASDKAESLHFVKGVRSTLQSAFLLLEKKAKEGDGSSLLGLGLQYYSGKNIVKDDKKAVALLIKASRNTHVPTAILAAKHLAEHQHKQALALLKALLDHNIAARQYFKPSLDTLPFVEHREVMRNSRDIASRILVIPMHSGVEPIVSEIIIKTLENIREKEECLV